jgi:uncharacterized membrane protein
LIVYVLVAAISVLLAVAAYYVHFAVFLHEGFSSDPTTWGDFGSYVGGVLGPILSFISLLFIIKSLRLQNEANEALRNGAKDNERSDQLKSFSALFFNMIDSQKSLLDKFKIVFSENGVSITRRGVDAIMKIEDEIRLLRDIGGTDARIADYIREVDSADQIFGILRAFYISVKMISEKLSAVNGFSVDERVDFFNTLINFTDFSQLRLVIMGIQFIDSPAASYLKGNGEFVSVLKVSGLPLNLY